MRVISPSAPISLFHLLLQWVRAYITCTPSHTHTTQHNALPSCPGSISKMGGVEGFVITDAEGVILRQSKAFSDELAQSYAAEVVKLARRARHVVRDLDPKVRAALPRALCAAPPTPPPARCRALFAHPSPRSFTTLADRP